MGQDGSGTVIGTTPLVVLTRASVIAVGHNSVIYNVELFTVIVNGGCGLIVQFTVIPPVYVVIPYIVSRKCFVQ